MADQQQPPAAAAAPNNSNPLLLLPSSSSSDDSHEVGDLVNAAPPPAAETAEIAQEEAREEDELQQLDLSFDDIPDYTATTVVAPPIAAPASSAPAASSLYQDQDEPPSCASTLLSLDHEDDGDDLKKGDEFYAMNEDEFILGTLIVRVVAARDLPNMGSGGGGGGLLFGFGGGGHHHHGRRGHHKGSANPYASVRFGATTQRTSQVFGTVDPVWPRGETMYMDVTHPNLSPTAGQPAAAGEPAAVSSTPATSPAPTPVLPVAATSTTTSETATTPNKRPAPPIVTIALFHSAANHSLKKLAFGTHPQTGDSDDVFLGMTSINLTQLLTGKVSTIDEWLPLSGGMGSSSSSVRLVCEYESSDLSSGLQPGDLVRLSGFANPRDLYPAPIDYLYRVEEMLPNDVCLVSYTSPEGWISTLSVHSYMLICEHRHVGTVEYSLQELESMAHRISHSPIVQAVQNQLDQGIAQEGLLHVGATAVSAGANILGRWLNQGPQQALADVVWATNWDGQFNPQVNLSTSQTSGSDDQQQQQDQELLKAAALADAAAAQKTSTAAALPNMPSCPITREPMRDPVVAADGHTYERAAIMRWLASSDKSPLTGTVLAHKNLVPNYMLLSSLQELQDQQQQQALLLKSEDLNAPTASIAQVPSTEAATATPAASTTASPVASILSIDDDEDDLQLDLDEGGEVIMTEDISF